MGTDSSGWWSRHGWTVAILLAAFAMAFAVRTIFTFPVLQQYGNLYVYAGGSDSYYHSRVMQYIIANHTNLIFDPLLNYPIGAINPREPLFDWMNAILGIVFAPLFGGNAVNAAAFFLNLQAPLWAALTVFPIYLIGKEVGDRRTGLIAAVIFPFLPASINESIFGYANYLSFYTFIILVVIYAYIRTIKAVGSRRWVETYRSPKSVYQGLRNFVRGERTAIKWAVFTGVSFGALALAWQGYTYAIAVVGVFIILAMLIERVRRIDSFGLYVTTWIVGLVGFPIAMPYYYVQHEFAGWFDLPLLLYFGILLLLLPFLFMRDIPWVVSIPTIVGVYLLAAIGLFVVEPTYFTEIVTGQGYFIKTLIYSTVAEAQSPSFDTLVVSYGIITFFLAFAGAALIIWALVRGRFQRWVLLFLVFAAISLYLPFSASKFLLLGAPAFALLPAEALRRLWDLGSYHELRQSVRSLTDTRSRLTALRKSFKARHVLIVLLVIGILVPNIWYGIDAGIPSNTKAAASSQVYDSLPSWLRPAASDASSFYFGAAGSSLDTPNLYDAAGYNWLATQQVSTPEPQRSAVDGWWDYGFQTIDQGQHPSVADNFQNGINPAGQFLLAQNQSIAIGVLAATLIVAEQTKSGVTYLPSSFNQVLAQDGVNLAKLHTYLVNQSTDFSLVVANPSLYLPVDPSTLTDQNAMYMVVSYYLATLSPTMNAKLYNDIQSYTGWSIRYALADTRLIPFSGSDTGIYYAPADLTGRQLDQAGNPDAYFNVTVLGSDGNYYPEGEVPADVQAVQYYISYFAPFYNSMIYKIYFGYNGTEVGLSDGIPGLTGSLQNDPVEPGWMESHFEVQYQTAYYCNNVSQASNQNCYVATNKPTALALAASQGGVADTNASAYFSGGESMLVYYAGQPMTGTITLPDGTPVAGARVTVTDGWGIPHQTVLTGANGQYSVILPPGNDTVNVTMGTFQGISQQGNIVLDSIPIAVPDAIGFSPSAPTLVYPITLHPTQVQGIVYWNIANASTYQPEIDEAVQGAKVVLWGVPNGTAITATTDVEGTFDLPNVPAGVYNYSVLYQGANYTQTQVYVDPASSPVNASAGLTPGNISGTVFYPDGGVVVGGNVRISSSAGTSETTGTNVSGAFTIQTIGPGNYTVTATGPGANERSLGTSVYVSDIGQHLTVNLTVYPTAPVTISVNAGVGPAPGVPVRLTNLAGFTNATSAGNYTANLDNSTVLYSNSAGVVTAYLPLGNYSVYASTYIGSTLGSAIGTLHVTTPGVSVVGPTLNLVTATWVRGSVSSVAAQNSTSVLLFTNPGGGTAIASTTNGSFAIALPSSAYSVLTLQAPTGQTVPLDAALSSVVVPSGAALSVTPVPALHASVSISAELISGTLYPASGANVTLRVGTSGPSITVAAGASGVASFIVPGTLGTNATFCLSASAPGFVTAQECGISPTGLSELGRLPVSFSPIQLAISLPGPPSYTSVSVYVNGTSRTAGNYTAQGSSTVYLTVTPGNYSIEATASASPNLTRYHTGDDLALSIPLGATSVSYRAPLLLETNTTGTISVPHGMLLANVTVTLTGGALNVSVNGTTFTKGFWAPAGSYSAYVYGSNAGLNYTNLSQLSVPSHGASSPTLHLAVLGATLQGSFVATNGSLIPATTQVVFQAPGGAIAQTTAVGGTFQLTLPSGTPYTVSASATLAVAGPNGSYAVSYTTLPGANVCTANAPSSTCNVTLVGTTHLVWFNGTLSTAGYPGLLAGTLTLVGPYPSDSVLSINATSGSFSAQILPGGYTLYASTTGLSTPYANLTQVTVLASSGSFGVTLYPTWFDRITVTPPPTGSITGGTAALSIRSGTGATLRYPSVAMNGTTSVALPIGGYTVQAIGTGAPYGATTTASASASVSILAGNVATQLALEWVVKEDVVGRVSGPSSVEIPASGGVVTFSVGLTNYGSAPVTVNLVGSPSYWNFTTSLTNVTLAAVGAANSTSGTVRIIVPSGTAVAHPAVALSVELVSNGTVIGKIAGAPIVNVQTAYGLTLTNSTSSSQVGPTQVLVPFAATNTGNIVEGVNFTVVDSALLASEGWTANIISAGVPVQNPTIAPGTSTTFFLNLTAPGVALQPKIGTVAATVLNATGGLQRSISLAIPSTAVQIQPHFGVSGPGTGTAPLVYAEWLLILLALVPALIVAVIALLVRWNRTRRWQR